MTATLKGGANLDGARATNAADASSATDLVTLQQLQAYVRGLDWKASVRAATTTNGTLATAYANGQTIDGVTLATGDRILLKDQSTGADNGIYTVNASGAPTRATDADASAEVTSGLAVTVTEGTANGDKTFVLTTNDPITLGSTSLVFSQLGGGASYTAAASGGLTLSSSAFSILLDTSPGLLLGAGGIKIDPAYAGLAKRYAADCLVTTDPQTFTHNLGTKDLVAAVRLASGDEVVIAKVTFPTTNTAVVDFGGAPTAGQYRLVLVG